MENLDLLKKLSILSDAAKYDVSCSSSGSNRKNTRSGIGNAAESGICHSFTPDGRCISLLKILLTNYCVYDCSYCVNRISNDVKRAAFTPRELADLTINFYKRNYIEGLFLSSAVFQNPNYTMELLIECIKILRKTYRFNGYIHVKAIPGADESLIKEAGLYADRMSVNIELPSSQSLKLLAPQKKKENILNPMNLISKEIISHKDLKNKIKTTPHFVPGGQSTQLIVGATPDKDLNILRLSESLYKKYSLKRVYYSAYVPVNNGGNLPTISHPPLLREHRLYQADWLLRFYGFNANELLDEKNPDFDMGLDPKTSWAIKNIELFPIEINKAPFEMLLRVPGIGHTSAIRICKTRRVSKLSFENIKKLGVVVKRARFFVTCEGKYYGGNTLDPENIRKNLYLYEPSSNGADFEQLSFFTALPKLYKNQDLFSKLHGEL